MIMLCNDNAMQHLCYAMLILSNACAPQFLCYPMLLLSSANLSNAMHCTHKFILIVLGKSDDIDPRSCADTSAAWPKKFF